MQENVVLGIFPDGGSATFINYTKTSIDLCNIKYFPFCLWPVCKYCVFSFITTSWEEKKINGPIGWNKTPKGGVVTCLGGVMKDKSAPTMNLHRAAELHVLTYTFCKVKHCTTQLWPDGPIRKNFQKI